MEKQYMYDFIQSGTVKIRSNGFMEHPAGFRIERKINDFDILYTLSGRYEMEINSTVYAGTENDIFLLEPGSRLLLTALADSRQFFCHFSMENGRGGQFGADFSDNKFPVGGEGGIGDLYCRNIKEYIEGEGKEPLYTSVALIIKLLLIEMIHTYPQNILTSVAGSSAALPEEICSALDYIHQNIDKDITAEQIAGETGFNTVYFNSYFKKFIGLTPCGYTNKCKMEYARQLICDSRKSISEAAGMLGFSDQFSFSKKFKKYYGISPSKMRETTI